MADNGYAFIIIGSGPAGLAAAMTAAKAGRRVLVVEKEGCLGGVCVNTGTFPSKTLREAVLLLTGHLKRKVFERESDCSGRNAEISMARLQARLHQVRAVEQEIIAGQFERNGVEVLRGSASFADRNHLIVRSLTDQQEKVVQGERIIIATGSRPRNPAEIPFDHCSVVDSTSVLDLAQIPASMLIIGGGVIGSEYATIFAALGIQVTLLDRGERPLKFLDGEITAELMRHFPGGNIHYVGNCGEFTVEGGEQATVTLADGRVFQAACLLFALGREANTAGLAIERAGIHLNQHRYIEVNELYQTASPNIYAVGDVIGWPSLAATSMVQGRLAALNGLKSGVSPFPRIFPFGIYTIPEISYVGITEEEARQRHFRIVIGRCRYHELPRAQISGECEGMLKMIVHADTREILGVHILGGGATEVIHIAQLALQHHARIDLFIDNIFNYPTYSEALKIAALSAANQLDRPGVG